MLVAGCSDSDDDSGAKKASSTPSSEATKPAPTPTVVAAKYPKLPEPCKAVQAKTVEKLVPKPKEKKGQVLTAGSCYWAGLDDSDADDLQFRSLNVQFNGLSADPTLGSADKRAQVFAEEQVKKAMKEDGAKDAKSQKTSGIGDWATTVTTTTKKNGDEFHNAWVITRTANVVVTLQFSGAGYQGAKAPDAAELAKDTPTPAKEAVAAVAAANKK